MGPRDGQEEQNMILNVEHFAYAVARLREGMERYERDTSDVQVRDGLIQRFEFTYELSHKILKRYLEATAPTPDQYDTMPFADLIRSGNEQGLLLGDWSAWKAYRAMRGTTSHTYAEAVALQVVENLPTFIREGEYLRDQIQRRMR
jgi:nucleotidyltransferase substrate binding protein (TIGR01987 family)